MRLSKGFRLVSKKFKKNNFQGNKEDSVLLKIEALKMILDEVRMHKFIGNKVWDGKSKKF